MEPGFNPDFQHTLKSPISISGTGLHTGINVDMTLNPANPGFGIQFKRIDLPGQPVVKADCELPEVPRWKTTAPVSARSNISWPHSWAWGSTTV
jgi:UDP-3-O-acyl-N-acetylglucosamine deacetylase